MKITKLVHSCMIVENNGRKILVDPGAYSWQDENVRNTDLSGTNSVVVTHNHPDHLDGEFAKAIFRASPDAKWFGTEQVADELQNISIACETSSNVEHIRYVVSEHADASPYNAEKPQHTSFVLFNDVLVSGDCQNLKSSHGARILAGAVNGGPWGAAVGFAKMIETMTDRPEFVVPLHDWHWNGEARQTIYKKLNEVMKQFDVEFILLENCKAVDIYNI